MSPAVHVATLQVGHFVVNRKHSVALAPLEARFAHVGTPCDGVAVVDSVVCHFEQFVNWHVLILSPSPVVSHFKGEWLIEWVVCERCDRNVVVHIDAERCCECLWSIVLAFVGEVFRNFAHISVEHALETFKP